MTKRQNTNLSDASQDASQSSTASYLNAESTAVQPPRSPRPSSRSSLRSPSRPMTRQGLGEALARAPTSTAQDMFGRVDENGDRRYEQILAGMPNANDDEAASPTPPASHDDDGASNANGQTICPRGHKRLRSEIDNLDTSPGPSKVHKDKHARFEEEIKRVDGCFRQEGESSGPSTVVDNDRPGENDSEDPNADEDSDEDIYDNDKDDRDGSPDVLAKTSNGNSQGPH